MSQEHDDGYDNEMVERILRADRECEKSPKMTLEELLAEWGFDDHST